MIDILKDTPSMYNNSKLNSINTLHLHIEGLQQFHQALNEDQSDVLMIENVVQGLGPHFPDANALLLYRKINGEIKLSTSCIQNQQDELSFLIDGLHVDNLSSPLLSVESFEVCAKHSCLSIKDDYEDSYENDAYENGAFDKLRDFLVKAKLKECLLIPVCLHNDANAVLVVLKKTQHDIAEEIVESAKVLLTNFFLMIQKRCRARLQAQLQTQLLEFQTIDKTFSEFAGLLLASEEAIFQIQILSLHEDYVYDFRVYGQMNEFEDTIKENVLSKGNVHISFNGTLERAVKTRSSIYTPDVTLDPEWSNESASKTRSIIYFPLLSYDKNVVGVFCATSSRVHGFSAADKCFLEQTMGVVNLAFQSHHRILDLQENVVQMGHLAEVSQTLQKTNSVEEAQFESLQVIMQETPASSCFFLEFNKEESYFRVKARANTITIDVSPGQNLYPDAKLLEAHLQTNSSAPLHLKSESPRAELLKSVKSVFGIDKAIEELILCPLVVKDSIITELAVIFTEDQFTASDISLAQTLISSYGNCISRIESNQLAKTEMIAYKNLAGFSAKIEEIQNFDELIDYGIKQLMSIFGITDANYYICIDDNETVVNAKSWGTELFSKDLVTISESPILHSVISQKQLLYVQDYPNHNQSLPLLIDKGLRSLVFLPVEYANTIVGCIALHGIDDRLKLNESDLDLIRQFLSRLRNALERTDYIRQLERSREDTLRSLGIVLEQRDLETRGHTDRVVELSRSFAKQLKLSDEQIKELVLGAYLHDIGKLAIPDRILLKPGKLSNEEFDEIKTHAMRGYNMAEKMPLLPRASSLLVRHHHEQWQGSGYPDKLKGEEIPFLARMFTLVDVYDALRSHRPYKKAWTQEESFEELRDKKGILFDPDLIEDFVVVAQAYDDVYKMHNVEQENIELHNQKQQLMTGP